MCNATFAKVYLNWVMYLSSSKHQQLVYHAVSSVQFIRSVLSDSLQPHALQYTRLWFLDLLLFSLILRQQETRGGGGEDVFRES